MATWRIIVQKKWFNLAGSIAVSSFKEILLNLRKFYLSFKEMCEIGSESPGQQFELSCRLNKNIYKAYVRKSIDRLFSYCKIFI